MDPVKVLNPPSLASTSHKLVQEENPISISSAPPKGKRTNEMPKPEDPPQRVDMEGHISPVWVASF